MKWGILILFPGSINIVLQCFFTAAKASVNSGNLILGSGEELKINTTVPSIVNNNCSSCNYNASHENRSSSSSHGEHLAAVISFSGNIEFRNGSTVQVFGKYGLSITSQNGHILIETDINMTCTEKVLDETCLGGFTQSSVRPLKDETPSNPKLLYKGLGPGGLDKTHGFILAGTCIPGSSHGGIALGPTRYSVLHSDPAYDQNDTASLLGGSGGSCAENPGSVAGGGAIEIVADKGCITINAIIRASAQNETDKSCSGGSGGLIRLNASHVELKEQGKLIVDGGNGKMTSKAASHLGGGAGGIIQIISAAGHLSPKALSLKGGTSVGTCTTEAENGYFYFIADTSRYSISNVETHPPTNPYNWSSSPSSSSPLRCFSVTPTHKSSTSSTRVKEFMKNSEAISTSLIQGDNLNESAILQNLATHKSLLSRNASFKDLEDLCVNIFENYTVIQLEIAKRHPGFAVVSLQGILNATSECILEKNHKFWRQNQQMPNLMETLEDALIATVNGTSPLEINYTLTTSNIVAQVKRNFVKAVTEDIKIPHHPNVPGDSWNKVSDHALIRKETFKDSKGV